MHQAVPLVVATLLLGACTGSDDAAQRRGPAPQAPATSATTSSPTSTPSRTSGTATCVSRADGYSVEHPSDWTARDASEREPCRWFSPEPIPPEAEQEPALVPVRLVFVPHTLDQVERLERADAEVLSSDRREVDGQPAVRQELRAAGPGLLPEGTRSTQWLVDFGSRTMIASTTEQAAAGTYAQNVQVLDAMMRSLRRLEQEPVDCSARGLPPEPEAQGDLPEAVQETRREIYLAAVRCDFDRLEELVPEEGFTYSFGGGDDPTGSWRRAELRDAPGPAPMRYLAALLQRPYGKRQVQGATHYAWPSAFTYDSWSDVPEADREALEPLYGPEDFEGFERFGGYVGYRVVIAADGTWRAFVAGD